MMENAMMGLDPNLLVNALANKESGEGGMWGGQGGLLWIFLLILFWGGGAGFGGNRNNAVNDMALTGQMEAAINKAQAAGCSDQLILTAINGNKEAINQIGSYLGVEVNQVQNAIQGLERGICDLGYRIGQDTASILSAINTGNCALSRQLADCCCATQRGLDSVKYDMATGFCALNTNLDKCCCDMKSYVGARIDAQSMEMRAGFQGIRDYLTAEKIAGLQTELQSAQFQLSQNAQTQNIENYIKNLLTVTCTNTTN